ncbi:DUF3307 domain-containing protein [Sunxiuqinia elliptica]|uniref:DUF3307 domain-containing protein n=1 Tax=Sunxiuqinia elliptica TaxID=655355 RepID=A0A1I2K5X3_9BACT|nr:DUF3307 domain-containing protein [Sunxiuqinia elliptica]SFF60316.1 Protein of unknown function [Sunxiuqinia elliptica]
MILVLRLLLAHLIADFLLQPNSWVKDKNEKGIRSFKLLLHILVVTGVSTILTIDFFVWQIPVFIFVLHYLIDLLKIYFRSLKANNLLWFIADQFLHIISIIGVAMLVGGGANQWIEGLGELLSSKEVLVVASAYCFIIWPSMIIINLATQGWQNQISDEMGPSLQNAGKWIGILERILVLTFVLAAQFQAIGFLIAAKSILRISVKTENSARILSEYVLIGTFISFTIAILVGLVANLFL